MFLNDDVREGLLRLMRHKAVFTGSYALILQGKLPDERIVHDIDLVFKSIDELNSFILSVPKLEIVPHITEKAHYAGSYMSLRFSDLSVKIDAFISPNEVVLSYGGINSTHFRNIILNKVNILLDNIDNQNDQYKKQLADLLYIFKYDTDPLARLNETICQNTI